ncbi:hypothetical protein VVD49_05945 [Uliginosibacterium sp. H3]|uniref:6-phosphogluconate dehydrogenase n=1 Tax=Uliginosibacterium silvisoli TaxID=3114758 RepID=A0ABU6K0U9_9RHOO|nr:hypothetical protein [Uliginosibacterium sp. H3]
MHSQTPSQTISRASRQRGKALPIIIGALILALLVAAYFAIVLNWSYSDGERAGYVQKFSRKGWICKTWEGDLALVNLPGQLAEIFHFTVHDEAVAAQINAEMGKRVTVHYDQRIGLPTSCFGDTRYFVDQVRVVEGVR